MLFRSSRFHSVGNYSFKPYLPTLALFSRPIFPIIHRLGSLGGRLGFQNRQTIFTAESIGFLHQHFYFTFADVKLFTAFCVYAVYNKMRVDMVTVAVGGHYNFKALELFNFLGKSNSNFVCRLRCYIFINREGLHEMIEQSAVCFTV